MPSSIDTDAFDVVLALKVANALKVILENRTRVKVILGEERVVPGTLGEVIRFTHYYDAVREPIRLARDDALLEFQTLWSTLSEKTTAEVHWMPLAGYDASGLGRSTFQSTAESADD